ncbi:MAG TPA: class I SAM-dependent methyltransferase, partial [Candidatus Limnocylindrales bacterium]
MADLGPCECGCANVFDDRSAAGDLQRYLRRGADRSTRELIEAVKSQGIIGDRVLDIGGGIGAIQLELLAAGAASAESVDASEAYVAVARAEAARRGLGAQTSYRVGDFVALASSVDAADAVTMDRIVCCYSDMPALLDRAADHARHVLALVYPRDALWMRVIATAMNGTTRLFRGKFRYYTHREAEMDARIRSHGFERRHLRRYLLWQVALYVRTTPSAPAAGAPAPAGPRRYHRARATDRRAD